MLTTVLKFCEDISIDFAVMEHAKNIDIVLSNFDWSDLGTWGSINSHLDHDAKGNSVIGAKTYLFNSSDCIINMEDGTTAVIDGLDGYIVVQSENRVMILKKDNEQGVKGVCEEDELIRNYWRTDAFREN